MFGWFYSTIFFTLIIFAFGSISFYVKNAYAYWQRRGVPFLKPSFPFGNFGKNILQKLSTDGQLDEFYYATSKPLIGVYAFFRPILIVRDPAIIRNILIKDFHHFVDRGVYLDEENDPLSANLFSLSTDKWRHLRQKLTPMFTSGKMRTAFETLLQCKDSLLKHIEHSAKLNKTIDVHEMAACYTTNAIASIAFGIDIDCFADPDTPFRKYGRQFFAPTLKNGFRVFCFNLCPILLRWTGIRNTDPDIEQFFVDMVKETLELRKNHNIVRNDLFQMLVQLCDSKHIRNEHEWKNLFSHNTPNTLTIEQATAQAFLFYVAGFETSSSTMSFCLYEIAKNENIQGMIHDEINHILNQHDGAFSYDSVHKLKYLECCIDETLRKYPVTPFLSRECTKSYKVPETKITLEKGTSVFIPVLSLHRDKRYYPNPDQFDPSRFFSANKHGKTIVDMPFLTFGDGPRNCIGLRLGKLFIAVGIASIIQKYHIELGHQHNDEEFEFLPNGTFLVPTTGIHLKFKPRR